MNTRGFGWSCFPKQSQNQTPMSQGMLYLLLLLNCNPYDHSSKAPGPNILSLCRQPCRHICESFFFFCVRRLAHLNAVSAADCEQHKLTILVCQHSPYIQNILTNFPCPYCHSQLYSFPLSAVSLLMASRFL